jgi:hypothetical protein
MPNQLAVAGEGDKLLEEFLVISSKNGHGLTDSRQ